MSLELVNPDAVNGIFDKYLPAPEVVAPANGNGTPAATVPVTPAPGAMPDDLVVKMALSYKNGTKLQRLLEGDLSDYPSQSEADMAFCSLLAFVTHNPDQIDRIMRSSVLMRPKWDTQRGTSTYGRDTIEKALRSVEQSRPPAAPPANPQNAALQAIYQGSGVVAPPSATSGATNGIAAAPLVAEVAEEPASVPDFLRLIYTPTWTNEPPPVPPVLTLNGQRIGSIGNLTVIIAAPGTGKSAVCEAIESKRMCTDADSFGLEVQTRRKVMYIDTERSLEDHFASWLRMTRRAGIERGAPIPDGALFHSFKLLPGEVMKTQALAHLLTTEDIGLVILDGIGDFVPEVNDAPACNAFLDWLLAVANQRAFAVLATIHHNPQPGNEKARGHLGSEAMRQAEAVLILKKDAATGQRTLTTNFVHGKVRNASDQLEAYFRWDDDLGMFRTCDNGVTESSTAPTTAEERHLLRVLFIAKLSYSYGELWREIMASKGCSESRAKRIIAKWRGENLVVEDLKKQIMLNENQQF